MSTTKYGNGGIGLTFVNRDGLMMTISSKNLLIYTLVYMTELYVRLNSGMLNVNAIPTQLIT